MNKFKKIGAILIIFTLFFGIKTNTILANENEQVISNSNDFEIVDNVLVSYEGNEKSVTIPSGVTRIGEYAFSLNEDIESISIPNTVTKIDEGAFAYCSNLKSLDIPNSVLTMGESAFEYCENLQEVTLPNKITKLENYTFYGCEELENINIPDSVTEMGESTFEECTSLSSIIIPSQLKVIAESTFYNCTNLSNVTISSSVNEIKEYAFSGCSKLTSITIPANITYISNNAFDNVYTIKIYGYKGTYAESFAEKNNITFNTIPSKVTGLKQSSNTTSSIKLSWNKVSNATGYKIYRATSKTGSYKLLKTISSNSTTTYTNSSLSSGKTYYYKIKAYKILGDNTYYSDYSSVLTAATKPSTVTGLKQSSNTTSSIKLSWNKVSNATGYKIYRATSKTGTYKLVKTISSNSTTTYTNSSLSSGKIYYYKVKSYKTNGENTVYGSDSSILTASTKCSTPSVTLTSTASKTVKVSWKQISGASGYEVYRATSKTGTYSKIKTITSGSTTSYTNSKLTSKKGYYYKVRAYKTVNGNKVYSSYSTIKYIKVK